MSDGQGVDHRAGSVVVGPEEGQGDRQAEAAGSGGAGVQPEGAAGLLDAGLMGVTRDHDVPPFGLWIGMQGVAVVDHVDPEAKSREGGRFRKSVGPVAAVDIAADRRDRGDACQLIEMLGFADIAGMQDVLNAREGLQRLGPERVRTGAPVEVIFERLSDEVAIPKFRLR